MSPTPHYVDWFNEECITVQRVKCGYYHCAAYTDQEELYTWGSNKDRSLGRDLRKGKLFTSNPGHVPHFNEMINRIGRGRVRDFACG